MPFIASFHAREYGAHSQNWAAVQDERGVMYFGNGNGVLQFDGVTWRDIPVANKSIVRSLALARSGTVYVGAVGELGYLRSDGSGNLVYVSLLGELDAEDRSFNDVWRTYAMEEGIYFWTFEKLLLWRGDRFESWPVDSDRVPCLVDGRIYSNQRGVGLTVLRRGSFQPIRGGESSKGLSLMMMLPHRRGEILAGSRDGKLWRISPAAEGGKGEPAVEVGRFETAADSYLAQHKLYSGVRLPDGSYALGTMAGGTVVIDDAGRLLHRLTRAQGLLDDSVWALYVDREQGVWQGLNRGISRAEIGSPWTVFGETTGLEGTVEAIARSAGKLHVATSVGLYRLEDRRLEPISTGEAPYWSLLAYGGTGGERRSLLVGALAGVYQARAGELEKVASASNAFVLYPSPSHPGVVYVGQMAGVGVLERVDGGWVDAGRLAGVDQEVRSIIEDSDGHLWLGTHFDGVARLAVSRGPELTVTEVRRFGREHGLPAVNNVKIHSLGGRLKFATPGGLHRFDPASEAFEPSSLLGAELADGGLNDTRGILRLSLDRDANAWMSLLGGDLAVAFRRPDGSYALDLKVLRRAAGESIHAILPEPSGIVWFGGIEGLFRLDTTNRRFSPAALAGAGADAEPRTAREAPFPVLIRRVSVAQPGGAVLFGGEPTATRPAPVLPYAQSSLRFAYALQRFDAPAANRFRSRLHGLDEAWSDWTAETYRDFTALREGRYRFEVQARDVHHRPSAVAAFELRVLPPWYRSWWAYALYALALAAAIWGIHSWRLRRVRLAMELERLTEANAVMRRSERERQQFVRELEAKNKEMERFIYTVSHDLKSPLISIRGFLGMLEKDIARGQRGRMKHDMERIHAATGKMAQLVHELLELSRIGRLANEPQVVALGELAREAVDQVAGPIAERGVEVRVASDLPAVSGDRQRLLALLQNLVENAVKYMGDQPRPRIEIDWRQDGDDTVCQIRDNGMGIDPRYHGKVFGLFERLSSRIDGTGLGLALAKRIVEVHGGRIWVESEGQGRGSTFCFTLASEPAPGTPEAASAAAIS